VVKASAPAAPAKAAAPAQKASPKKGSPKVAAATKKKGK